MESLEEGSLKDKYRMAIYILENYKEDSDECGD